LAAARGTSHVAGPSTYDATRVALVATLHYLDVLCILSRRAGANAPEPPSGRTPDECRKKLISKFGVAFEVMHGCRCVVSNQPQTARRLTVPDGPALAWTRALLDIAPTLQPPSTLQQPVDTLPELHDLARWAKGTDTLAEAIRGRSRSRRAARWGAP
jgi:hypothetical protein